MTPEPVRPSKEERIFDIQQECARLDFVTRGEDKTARWVAEQLAAALATDTEEESKG